ncbi:DNA adenine methylase [Erwinia sp. ACCC 02193]|uniref:Site-specific DNA-methyltransferase (adenine-specific) n=1 Tax=Erwinia aeris TaxID=3239803 RepID=A0ABV4E5W6_9GAMM
MNKTILKWAGSKAGVMPALSLHLPQGDRLVEPFAGSCAVMMNTDFPAYLVVDVNPDLINMYRQIKEITNPFIVTAMKLFIDNEKAEDYYRIREEFNSCPSLTLLQRATYFLYLNRNGYRGLCRYNRKGEFNIPYGNYKKPYFPMAEIEAFAERAQRAEFICADFRETLGMVKTGDVVYCDPPYHGAFTDYHTGGFSEDDQHSLACILLGISEQNPVAVSNSDTLFTRSIFRAFDITRINVARSVGVAAGKSKCATEIVAVRCPKASPVFIGVDMGASDDYSAIIPVAQ